VQLLSPNARDRLSGKPVARLRRIVIALYLAVAAADAAGKALVATPSINRAASRFVRAPQQVENLQNAARPAGNFEIFRLASLHLVTGENLYADYPDEAGDRFKYSPSFALLFAPFAILYWPFALFLWHLLNMLLLVVAVDRVLPRRAALLAQFLLLLEVLRGQQNAQSNSLVAALIILAWSSLEKNQAWKTAISVALGASVKIFPLAALTFAVPARKVFRTAWWAAIAGAVLAALPLIVTSPATLLAQYRAWQTVESFDTRQRWFSAMELLHRLTGWEIPNWPVQVAGTLLLLLPLAIRRNRWDESRFRFLYLCSLLIYVVVFNHQAERASYLIAFTGATLWFAGEPRAEWRSILYGVALFTIPVMSTLVPGAIWRNQTVTLFRLAVPSLAIWIAIQCALLRRASFTPPAETLAA
jgi:hypothetical protein